MDNIKIPNPNTFRHLLEIPDDKEIKRVGKNFIKIVVFDSSTSHKALASYIKKRWPAIQFYLKNKNRRTRGSKYPDLDQKINGLNLLTTEELYKFAKKDKSKIKYSRSYLMGEILKPKSKDREEYIKGRLTRSKKSGTHKRAP